MKGRVFMTVANQPGNNQQGTQQPQQKTFHIMDGPSQFELCSALTFAFNGQASHRINVTVGVGRTNVTPTGTKKLDLQILGIEHVSARFTKGRFPMADTYMVLAREKDGTYCELKYYPVTRKGDLTTWPTRQLSLSSNSTRYKISAGPSKYEVFSALTFAFHKRAPQRINFTVEMPSNATHLKLLDLKVLGIEFKGAAQFKPGANPLIVTSTLVILAVNTDGELVELDYNTNDNSGTLRKLT